MADQTNVVPSRADVAAAVRATPPGELSEQARAMIAERKAHGALIAQLKAATWAKEMDENTVRAIAAWARQHDIDAATEIDVLGGNLYVNAKEAYRRLGELTAAGVLQGHGPADWIHRDERLEALAAAGDAWAVQESTRRARSRIEHDVPETATAACVYRIWHRDLGQPVEGCKWNQKGRTLTIKRKDGGSFEKQADPVGDLFPRETVESRAIRRAMLKLRGAVPALAERLRLLKEEAVAVSEVVATARVAERERGRIEPRQLAAAEVEPMPPLTPAQRSLVTEPAVEPAEESDAERLAWEQRLNEEGR